MSPYSSACDESCSLRCLHRCVETGFEGLCVVERSLQDCSGGVIRALTGHHLLNGFFGRFPGFAVKEEEVASGRAKLVAFLPLHKVLVSLYDLLHSLMVIQGG